MRTQVQSGTGTERGWRAPTATVRTWQRWVTSRESKGWTWQQAVWQGVSVGVVTGLVWSLTGQMGTALAVGGLQTMFWALAWCVNGLEE